MTQPGQAGRIFVGRLPEMAGLRAAMDNAVAGHGRLVMLAGEPGIGKTRTAQELSGYAESVGAQVWWGSCHEQQGAPPYWPWVQPIRSYIQRTGPESLATQMGPGAADISEIIPLIREKLPNLDPASSLDPEQARFRLFDSISQFFVNAARAQPLLLVLDDLHWADQPSLLLLEFLAGQLSDSNIMIVGTYRDIEVSREHPLTNTLARLARSDSYLREELEGLETEYVGQFIKDISGVEPSSALVQTIYGHTEGNPFFMTEIIRLLGQKGLASIGSGENSISVLEIPQGVLEVVGQRLNRLSTECERTLTTAAVIGRQFDFRVLGSLTEETSESQLLKSMDEGLDAHLIQEIPGQGDNYQFSHALIQQTLRERLSTSRRVRLHAKIGETLEKLYGDQPGEHAAELAFHFAEAEAVAGTDKLVKYTMLAGERALKSFAHEEALDYFARGLAARSIDLDGASPVPDAEAASLLFGLGRAQAAVLGRQGLDVAFTSLERAFKFYAGTNDVANVMRVADYPVQYLPGQRVFANLVAEAIELVPPDSTEAGRLSSRNILAMGLEAGDYARAMASFDNALSIAQRTGDLPLESLAMANSSWVDYWHLRWQGTIEKGLRAIELAQQSGDTLLEVSARFWVGVTHLGKGDLLEARRDASAILSIAETLRDRYRLATALWLNEMAYSYQGDWKAAREFNDRGLSVSPSDSRLLASRMVLEFELGNSADGQRYLDQLTEAINLVTPGPRYDQATTASKVPLAAHITRSVDNLPLAEKAAAMVLSAETATPLVSRLARLGLGLIAFLKGDAEAAREQYDKLLPASGSYIFVSCDRVLGLIAQTMGEMDQAATHFEASLAFCRDAGYRPDLAWTCHDYAAMLLTRNGAEDRTKALELLDESVAISSELLMLPLNDRTNVLRESAVSAPVPAPAGLSRREMEVIRLVAAGRTDREIGEELFISIKTVGNHMSNILNKTGAANRAEAASFATRHGLD